MAGTGQSGLLEDFRSKWLLELTSSQSRQQSGKSNRGGTDSEAPSSSTSKSQGSGNERSNSKFHPAFRNDEQRTTREKVNDPRKNNINSLSQTDDHSKTSYYPFNIVDNLIQSASVPSESDNVQSQSDQRANCKGVGGTPQTSAVLNSNRKRLQGTNKNELCAKKTRLKDVFSTKAQPNEFELKERILDRFIADVDEITEIPFFDLSVPREVALKIFQYLDMVDLCHCAQVSSSWRNLAEDELLWCRISHKLGYNEGLVTRECVRWKNIVKENLENRRNLIANWKAHLGEVQQLQYISGGILCSVDSCGSTVVAGYKNCDVKMWNIEDGGECTFKPSNTSLLINEALEEGTISNYVETVAVSPTLVAASYHQGNVDIWRMQAKFGTMPVSTFQDDRYKISHLCVTQQTDMVIAAAGPYIHLCQNPGEEEIEAKTVFGTSQQINIMQVLEQKNEKPCVATATNNIVNVCNTKEPQNSMTEIHNIIDCCIYCMDIRTAPCLLAVGLFDKVKMYDVCSSREITTLYGHTHRLTCINIKNSPENQMVTGSGDRKVRVYDLRSSQPVSTFSGHLAAVTSVQMDDWKVISGGEDGFVCLWDRRMAVKLWDIHSRHPVKHCSFTENLLIAGNIPSSKFPVMDDFENITHRRYRGEVRVYNFRTNQMTEGVPEICLSTYDEPEASNYNMNLVVPYDAV